MENPPRTAARSRALIDAVLKDLMDQVPSLIVTGMRFEPSVPADGQETIVQIDLEGNATVICEISPEGRLQSARVIENE